MPPATLSLIVFAVQEAIAIEPKVEDIIRKILDKKELTDEDLDLIKAKTLSLKINLE